MSDLEIKYNTLQNNLQKTEQELRNMDYHKLLEDYFNMSISKKDVRNYMKFLVCKKNTYLNELGKVDPKCDNIFLLLSISSILVYFLFILLFNMNAFLSLSILLIVYWFGTWLISNYRDKKKQSLGDKLYKDLDNYLNNSDLPNKLLITIMNKLHSLSKKTTENDLYREVYLQLKNNMEDD